MGSYSHAEFAKFNEINDQVQPINNGGKYEDEILLLKPFEYIRTIPGKQIRSKLLRSFNVWLQVPEKEFDKILEIVEILHNASLMIDDIEDGSELRRGQPAAHIVFGIPQTMNSANFVYFIALEKILKLNNPKAISIFCAQMLDAHRGQGLDIYWRDNFYCPTEEQYKDVICKKTGGLFEFSIQLLQLFSNDQRCYAKCVHIFGLYFQIRDDLINLIDPKYFRDKTLCEDLTEGKFSFPIIHAIQNNTAEVKEEMNHILKQRTTNIDLKKKFISLLEQSGSIEYTKRTLNAIEMEIRKEVEHFGGNETLEFILDELTNRKHN